MIASGLSIYEIYSNIVNKVEPLDWTMILLASISSLCSLFMLGTAIVLDMPYWEHEMLISPAELDELPLPMYNTKILKEPKEII